MHPIVISFLTLLVLQTVHSDILINGGREKLDFRVADNKTRKNMNHIEPSLSQEMEFEPGDEKIARDKRMLNSHTPHLSLLPMYDHHLDPTLKTKRCRNRHSDAERRLELDRKLQLQSRRLQALHHTNAYEQYLKESSQKQRQCVPCKCAGQTPNGNCECRCGKNCQCPAAIARRRQENAERIRQTVHGLLNRDQQQYKASRHDKLRQRESARDRYHSLMKEHMTGEASGKTTTYTSPVGGTILADINGEITFRPQTPRSDPSGRILIPYYSYPTEGTLNAMLSDEPISERNRFYETSSLSRQPDITTAANDMFPGRADGVGYFTRQQLYNSQTTMEYIPAIADTTTSTLSTEMNDDSVILDREAVSYEAKDEQFDILKPKPLLNYLHYFRTPGKSLEVSTESDESLSSSESNIYTTIDSIKQLDTDLTQIPTLQQKVNLAKIVRLGSPQPWITHDQSDDVIFIDKANYRIPQSISTTLDPQLVLEKNGFNLDESNEALLRDDSTTTEYRVYPSDANIFNNMDNYGLKPSDRKSMMHYSSYDSSTPHKEDGNQKLKFATRYPLTTIQSILSPVTDDKYSRSNFRKNSPSLIDQETASLTQLQSMLQKSPVTNVYDNIRKETLDEVVKEILQEIEQETQTTESTLFNDQPTKFKIDTSTINPEMNMRNRYNTIPNSSTHGSRPTSISIKDYIGKYAITTDRNPLLNTEELSGMTTMASKTNQRQQHRITDNHGARFLHSSAEEAQGSNDDVFMELQTSASGRHSEMAFAEPATDQSSHQPKTEINVSHYGDPTSSLAAEVFVNQYFDQNKDSSENALTTASYELSALETNDDDDDMDIEYSNMVEQIVDPPTVIERVGTGTGIFDTSRSLNAEHPSNKTLNTENTARAGSETKLKIDNIEQNTPEQNIDEGRNKTTTMISAIKIPNIITTGNTTTLQKPSSIQSVLSMVKDSHGNETNEIPEFNEKQKLVSQYTEHSGTRQNKQLNASEDEVSNFISSGSNIVSIADPSDSAILEKAADKAVGEEDIILESTKEVFTKDKRLPYNNNNGKVELEKIPDILHNLLREPSVVEVNYNNLGQLPGKTNIHDSIGEERYDTASATTTTNKFPMNSQDNIMQDQQISNFNTERTKENITTEKDLTAEDSLHLPILSAVDPNSMPVWNYKSHVTSTNVPISGINTLESLPMEPLLDNKAGRQSTQPKGKTDSGSSVPENVMTSTPREIWLKEPIHIEANEIDVKVEQDNGIMDSNSIGDLSEPKNASQKLPSNLPDQSITPAKVPPQPSDTLKSGPIANVNLPENNIPTPIPVVDDKSGQMLSDYASLETASPLVDIMNTTLAPNFENGPPELEPIRHDLFNPAETQTRSETHSSPHSNMKLPELLVTESKTISSDEESFINVVPNQADTMYSIPMESINGIENVTPVSTGILDRLSTESTQFVDMAKLNFVSDQTNDNVQMPMKIVATVEDLSTENSLLIPILSTVQEGSTLILDDKPTLQTTSLLGSTNSIPISDVPSTPLQEKNGTPLGGNQLNFKDMVPLSNKDIEDTIPESTLNLADHHKDMQQITGKDALPISDPSLIHLTEFSNPISSAAEKVPSSEQIPTLSDSSTLENVPEPILSATQVGSGVNPVNDKVPIDNTPIISNNEPTNAIDSVLDANQNTADIIHDPQQEIATQTANVKTNTLNEAQNIQSNPNDIMSLKEIETIQESAPPEHLPEPIQTMSDSQMQGNGAESMLSATQVDSGINPKNDKLPIENMPIISTNERTKNIDSVVNANQGIADFMENPQQEIESQKANLDQASFIESSTGDVASLNDMQTESDIPVLNNVPEPTLSATQVVSDINAGNGNDPTNAVNSIVNANQNAADITDIPQQEIESQQSNLGQAIFIASTLNEAQNIEDSLVDFTPLKDFETISDAPIVESGPESILDATIAGSDKNPVSDNVPVEDVPIISSSKPTNAVNSILNANENAEEIIQGPQEEIESQKSKLDQALFLASTLNQAQSVQKSAENLIPEQSVDSYTKISMVNDLKDKENVLTAGGDEFGAETETGHQYTNNLHTSDFDVSSNKYLQEHIKSPYSLDHEDIIPGSQETKTVTEEDSQSLQINKAARDKLILSSPIHKVNRPFHLDEQTSQMDIVNNSILKAPETLEMDEINSRIFQATETPPKINEIVNPEPRGKVDKFSKEEPYKQINVILDQIAEGTENFFAVTEDPLIEPIAIKNSKEDAVDDDSIHKKFEAVLDPDEDFQNKMIELLPIVKTTSANKTAQSVDLPPLFHTGHTLGKIQDEEENTRFSLLQSDEPEEELLGNKQPPVEDSISKFEMTPACSSKSETLLESGLSSSDAVSTFNSKDESDEISGIPIIDQHNSHEAKDREEIDNLGIVTDNLIVENSNVVGNENYSGQDIENISEDLRKAGTVQSIVKHKIIKINTSKSAEEIPKIESEEGNEQLSSELNSNNNNYIVGAPISSPHSKTETPLNGDKALYHSTIKYESKHHPKFKFASSSSFDWPAPTENSEESIETVYCTCQKYVNGKWIPISHGPTLFSNIPYYQKLGIEPPTHSVKPGVKSTHCVLCKGIIQPNRTVGQEPSMDDGSLKKGNDTFKEDFDAEPTELTQMHASPDYIVQQQKSGEHIYHFEEKKDNEPLLQSINMQILNSILDQQKLDQMPTNGEETVFSDSNLTSNIIVQPEYSINNMQTQSTTSNKNAPLFSTIDPAVENKTNANFSETVIEATNVENNIENTSAVDSKLSTITPNISMWTITEDWNENFDSSLEETNTDSNETFLSADAMNSRNETGSEPSVFYGIENTESSFTSIDSTSQLKDLSIEAASTNIVATNQIHDKEKTSNQLQTKNFVTLSTLPDDPITGKNLVTSTVEPTQKGIRTSNLNQPSSFGLKTDDKETSVKNSEETITESKTVSKEDLGIVGTQHPIILEDKSPSVEYGDRQDLNLDATQINFFPANKYIPNINEDNGDIFVKKSVMQKLGKETDDVILEPTKIDVEIESNESLGANLLDSSEYSKQSESNSFVSTQKYEETSDENQKIDLNGRNETNLMAKQSIDNIFENENFTLNSMHEAQKAMHNNVSLETFISEVPDRMHDLSFEATNMDVTQPEAIETEKFDIFSYNDGLGNSDLNKSNISVNPTEDTKFVDNSIEQDEINNDKNSTIHDGSKVPLIGQVVVENVDSGLATTSLVDLPSTEGAKEIDDLNLEATKISIHAVNSNDNEEPRLSSYSGLINTAQDDMFSTQKSHKTVNDQNINDELISTTLEPNSLVGHIPTTSQSSSEETDVTATNSAIQTTIPKTAINESGANLSTEMNNQDNNRFLDTSTQELAANSKFRDESLNSDSTKMNVLAISSYENISNMSGTDEKIDVSDQDNITPKSQLKEDISSSTEYYTPITKPNENMNDFGDSNLSLSNDPFGNSEYIGKSNELINIDEQFPKTLTKFNHETFSSNEIQSSETITSELSTIAESVIDDVKSGSFSENFQQDHTFEGNSPHEDTSQKASNEDNLNVEATKISVSKINPNREQESNISATEDIVELINQPHIVVKDGLIRNEAVITNSTGETTPNQFEESNLSFNNELTDNSDIVGTSKDETKISDSNPAQISESDGVIDELPDVPTTQKYTTIRNMKTTTSTDRNSIVQIPHNAYEGEINYSMKSSEESVTPEKVLQIADPILSSSYGDSVSMEEITTNISELANNTSSNEYPNYDRSLGINDLNMEATKLSALMPEVNEAIPLVTSKIENLVAESQEKGQAIVNDTMVHIISDENYDQTLTTTILPFHHNVGAIYTTFEEKLNYPSQKPIVYSERATVPTGEPNLNIPPVETVDGSELLSLPQKIENIIDRSETSPSREDSHQINDLNLDATINTIQLASNIDDHSNIGEDDASTMKSGSEETSTVEDASLEPLKISLLPTNTYEESESNMSTRNEVDNSIQLFATETTQESSAEDLNGLYLPATSISVFEKTLNPTDYKLTTPDMSIRSKELSMSESTSKHILNEIEDDQKLNTAMNTTATNPSLHMSSKELSESEPTSENISNEIEDLNTEATMVNIKALESQVFSSNKIAGNENQTDTQEESSSIETISEETATNSLYLQLPRKSSSVTKMDSNSAVESLTSKSKPKTGRVFKFVAVTSEESSTTEELATETDALVLQPNAFAAKPRFQDTRKNNIVVHRNEHTAHAEYNSMNFETEDSKLNKETSVFPTKLNNPYDNSGYSELVSLERSEPMRNVTPTKQLNVITVTTESDTTSNTEAPIHSDSSEVLRITDFRAGKTEHPTDQTMLNNGKTMHANVHPSMDLSTQESSTFPRDLSLTQTPVQTSETSTSWEYFDSGSTEFRTKLQKTPGNNSNNKPNADMEIVGNRMNTEKNQQLHDLLSSSSDRIQTLPVYIYDKNMEHNDAYGASQPRNYLDISKNTEFRTTELPIESFWRSPTKPKVIPSYIPGNIPSTSSNIALNDHETDTRKIINSCDISLNRCATNRDSLKAQTRFFAKQREKNSQKNRYQDSRSESTSSAHDNDNISVQSNERRQGGKKHTIEDLAEDTDEEIGSSVETLERPISALIHHSPSQQIKTTTPISLDPHLATTIRAVFGPNFGRIITDTDSSNQGFPKQMYFVGNGIKLPLIAVTNQKGEYELTLDVSKICEAHCKKKNIKCDCKRRQYTTLKTMLTPDDRNEEIEEISNESVRNRGSNSESDSEYEYTQESGDNSIQSITNEKQYYYKDNPWSKKLSAVQSPQYLDQSIPRESSEPNSNGSSENYSSYSSKSAESNRVPSSQSQQYSESGTYETEDMSQVSNSGRKLNLDLYPPIYKEFNRRMGKIAQKIRVERATKNEFDVVDNTEKTRVERSTKPDLELTTLVKKNGFLRKHFEQPTNYHKLTDIDSHNKYISRINRHLSSSEQKTAPVAQSREDINRGNHLQIEATKHDHLDESHEQMWSKSKLEEAHHQLTSTNLDNLEHKENTFYSRDSKDAKFPSLDFLTKYDHTIIPTISNNHHNYDSDHFRVNFQIPSKEDDNVVDKAFMQKMLDKLYLPSMNQYHEHYPKSEGFSQVHSYEDHRGNDNELYKYLFEHFPSHDGVNGHHSDPENQYGYLDTTHQIVTQNQPAVMYKSTEGPQEVYELLHTRRNGNQRVYDKFSEQSGMYDKKSPPNLTQRGETPKWQSAQGHHETGSSSHISGHRTKGSKHHSSSDKMKRHHSSHRSTNDIVKKHTNSPMISVALPEEKNECDEFVNKRLGLVRSLINWVRDWVTETAVKTKQAISAAAAK